MNRREFISDSSEHEFVIPVEYVRITASIDVGDCFRSIAMTIPGTQDIVITTTMNADLSTYLHSNLDNVVPQPLFGWGNISRVSAGNTTYFKHHLEMSSEQPWQQLCKSK